VVNGYQPCCICVDITCIPPPCTDLKIVVAGTNSPDGFWDYTRPYDCICNRVRFDVVCIDGSSINNWIYTNGLTGEIKWELVNGNFLFSSTLNQCGTNPNCGNYANCDIRPIVHGAYMQSSWICACQNLGFWENFQIRATVTLRQAGQVVLSRTMTQVVHLNNIFNNCGGGGGGGNQEKIISPASGMKLFPNPANGKATIEFNLAEKAKADAGLYDVAGNKILDFNVQKSLDKGKHQFSVNTKQLLDKLYFVVLKINDVIVMRESLAIE
jgi:Secretion system C-terminal sorting domain